MNQIVVKKSRMALALAALLVPSAYNCLGATAQKSKLPPSAPSTSKSQPSKDEDRYRSAGAVGEMIFPYLPSVKYNIAAIRAINHRIGLVTEVPPSELLRPDRVKGDIIRIDESLRDLRVDRAIKESVALVRNQSAPYRRYVDRWLVRLAAVGLSAHLLLQFTRRQCESGRRKVKNLIPALSALKGLPTKLSIYALSCAAIAGGAGVSFCVAHRIDALGRHPLAVAVGAIVSFCLLPHTVRPSFKALVTGIHSTYLKLRAKV